MVIIQSANEYCNRILDLEPRNAQVYFYKLLVSLKLNRSEDILLHNQPLDKYPDYQKAVRFADNAYKTEIENYNLRIIDRLQNEQIEGMYQKASSRMLNAKTEEEYIAAAKLFDGIQEYKDSSENANLCRISAEERRIEKEHQLEEERKAAILAKERQLEEERKAAEQAREREERYKDYCSRYSEQLELLEIIKSTQKDLEGLYEVQKQNKDQGEKKYIQKVIRTQEKKLDQYNNKLKRLPIIRDFK